MLATSALSRAGLFFVVAAAATALLTPLALSVALRIGLVDRPTPHKFHRRPTPYLGGLAILLSVLGVLIVATLLEGSLRAEILAIALGGAGLAAMGLVDDWLTINPLPRVAAQLLAAMGLWIAGIRLTPTGVPPVDLAASVLAVLAVTNAVNLLDNMDGLSAGTVAIVCLFSFVVAYWQGQQLVPVMAIILAGACLGFLPYNFSPARIFLGDAGTLFMGFLVATTLIKLDLHAYAPVTRVAIPGLIISVPLFDTALVVISRWRGGRPVFRGGTDHSSHRLVALGASPREAVLIIYAATVISGAVALFLLRIDVAATWMAVAAILGLGILLLSLLERVHPPSLARVAGLRRPPLDPARSWAETDAIR